MKKAMKPPMPKAPAPGKAPKGAKPMMPKAPAAPKGMPFKKGGKVKGMC